MYNHFYLFPCRAKLKPLWKGWMTFKRCLRKDTQVWKSFLQSKQGQCSQLHLDQNLHQNVLPLKSHITLHLVSLKKTTCLCWLKCIHVVFWYFSVILPLNLYFPEACLHFRFITWRLNAQALYPELFKSKRWMHFSLFNSVLNSTASNRKATDHSCVSKQPSDAELAKRKNVRAKAKSGIKVYQFVSFTWSNLK